MPQSIAQGRPAAGSRLIALGQVFVLGFVLATCTLWPRAGKPMLLVAVGQQGEQAALAFARQHGEPLLGAGRLPGSIVVQGHGDLLGLEALTQGIIPIAAPDLLCAAPLTIPNAEQSTVVSPRTHAETITPKHP
jgi:hypothetical protein